MIGVISFTSQIHDPWCAIPKVSADRPDTDIEYGRNLTMGHVMLFHPYTKFSTCHDPILSGIHSWILFS